MRRLACLIALLALITAAGCGGDDAGSALDEALGHLPEDAPVVFVASTDLDSDQYRTAHRLPDKFLLGDQLKDQIRQELSE